MTPNAKSPRLATGTGLGPERCLKQQLLRGGVSGFLVRVGSVLAGLVASVVLARLLGPETYGIYAFVFSIITIVGLPVKMGLPTLVLRETARADQAADGALMRGIWRWSDQAIALTSIAVLSVTALYIWLVHGVEAPHTAALLCALPLVPLIGLAEARGAAIRGLRRIALGVAPDKIGRPLLLALAVALASWLNSGSLNAGQVFAVHGAVALGTVILAIVIRNRIEPQHPSFETPRTMPKAWISLSSRRGSKGSG